MATFKCCHKCVAPKRHPGCHADCPDYAKDKADYEARVNYLKSTDADKVLMTGCEKYNNETAIHNKKYPKSGRSYIYH